MTAPHTLVVEVDQAYADRFPGADPVHRVWLVCPDPGACPASVECDQDHPGADPEDDTGTVYEQFEDVPIHGVLHAWTFPGWSVDYPGCPAVDAVSCGDTDTPDALYPLRPGRWQVDAVWDDQDVTLHLITATVPA